MLSLLHLTAQRDHRASCSPDGEYEGLFGTLSVYHKHYQAWPLKVSSTSKSLFMSSTSSTSKTSSMFKHHYRRPDVEDTFFTLNMLIIASSSNMLNFEDNNFEDGVDAEMSSTSKDILDVNNDDDDADDVLNICMLLALLPTEYRQYLRCANAQSPITVSKHTISEQISMRFWINLKKCLGIDFERFWRFAKNAS